jgi:hypothetical protein
MKCTFLSRLPRFLFTRHLPPEKQEQDEAGENKNEEKEM